MKITELSINEFHLLKEWSYTAGREQSRNVGWVHVVLLRKRNFWHKAHPKARFPEKLWLVSRA
jgi:hypothetical protein